MTDWTGDDIESAVYTAFGERVSGTQHRYGYAGAHGYQTTLDDGAPAQEVFPFLHVGHRYIDPAIGRFLQRDPIGIGGGQSVYDYARNSPAQWADPSGLYPHGVLQMKSVYEGWRNAGKSVEEAVELTTQWSTETGLIETGAVLVLGGANPSSLSTGMLSLGTRDPGFLRWGPGVISAAGELWQRGWRIAIGGPQGGWPFHIHIHRLNWWKPWRWFMWCR